jgi:hypothetical protein
VIDQFETYFNDIAIPKVLRNRIALIAEFYEITCLEPIADIFVTDYIADEEGRRFENAWFFAEHYVMEAKQFASQDDFDSMCFQLVNRWQVSKNDYDFVKAVPSSRMTLHFSMDRCNADLRAAQENCDYLRDIMMKYVVPFARLR